MRAPGFWSRTDPSVAARLLRPLGALYAAATARRVAREPDHRAGVPVICLGNLTAGGTGKTPAAIALAGLLQARGLEVAVVSRGYGGALQGPVRVDPERHGADAVGDEPLLLAAFAPVWVSRDRAAGVRAAETSGAAAILLDDGFQNPSVAKDLSLVVVDAEVGFGNGLPIPAGPLRETVGAGLARADAILSVGAEAAQAAFRSRWGDLLTPPVLTARLVPLPTGLPLDGLKAVAFAGIGRPSKFFRTLRDAGAEPVREIALGDHQPLTPTLMRRLEREAAALNAQLVTTEKDAVRLPASFRTKVMTVPVRLEFDDPAAMNRLLDPLFAPGPAA